MKKKNENKKTKVIGLGVLSFLLTSGAIITPIMLRHFNKNNTNINKTQLESWTNSNIVNTSNLDSLLNADSNSLKEHLVNAGIVSLKFSNEIKNIKFVVSKNNNQLNSNKVKLDLVIETNDGNTNETVYGINSSINIINFDTNKFINEFQKIEISNLSTLLNSTNIKNTIYGMNVGFVEGSLQNVSVLESTRNNAILKNSFSPFASTTNCVYKLDFTFNTTSDYLFNTNTSTFGDPNFTNISSLNNCITKAVNPVEFNDSKLKSEIASISDYNSINDLLNNQNSLINLVNQSNIVANNDWISSANITVSASQNNKLQVSVTTTLINGQIHTTTIETNINVVTFDREKFMQEMLKETEYNNLTLDNFVNTLKAMNVISNNSTININSTTADQQEDYREIENNRYYIYNVDIGLNSDSIFLEGNSILNSISLKNVDTSVPRQVNINKNKLELAVAQVTGNKTDYNLFLNKTSEDLKQLVIDSGALNISNGESVIQNVTVSKVDPSSSDEFVKVKINVEFVSSVTENNPASLIVNTGLRIVRILEDNIRTYFKTSVNNDTQVNNELATSLIASNANLTINNLDSKNLFAVASNPAYIENDLNNLPCKVFDLTLNLNDGYVYLDDSNQIQTQKLISNVLTSIVSEITINIDKIIQEIGNVNTIGGLNSIINDKVNFVKNNIVIDNRNWVKNVTLEIQNKNGKIEIGGTINLTNGQSIAINSTPTQLKVVNFDENVFIKYIKENITSADQLNSTNIINTITTSNSGLNTTNLKSANASAHLEAMADPERNNNTYFQYDFTFDLQDGYCFYDNITGLITNTKILNDVFTSIIDNATISNVDKVINDIKNATSNVNDLQVLLGNQNSIEQIINDANIVSDNNLINTIELTDVTSESDSNVTLQLKVTLTNGQEAINKKIETNIKIVKVNQDSLKQFFQHSVTTETMINNSSLISTLYSSNSSGSGIINDCLETTTNIALTSTKYQNIGNIPFNEYNLMLNLKNDYCFYNFNDKTLSLSQTINQIVSGIKYDIIPNSQTLETEINNIDSYSELLKYSKNTSDSLLELVKNTNGYVDHNVWVVGVEDILLTNVSNKVNISFNIRFSTDKIVSVSATTNVTILTFNETTFTNEIANVDVSTKLDTNSTELKQLIQSSLSLTTNGTISDASSQRLNDYYNDNNTGINYYKYNFDFTLADQYCFFNDGSISNQKNLNSGYKTNIYVPVDIDTQFELLITKLQNMTLEDGENCYTNIFDGTSRINPNAGSITLEKVKEITKLDTTIFNSFNIVKDSNTNDGMLKLRIEGQLNVPYNYNGSTIINKVITTNTYDPNSSYNISLFNISGGTISGLNTNINNYTRDIIYAPLRNWTLMNPITSNTVAKKISFIFSNPYKPNAYGIFRNSSFTEIDFSGCSNFSFGQGGWTNTIRDCRNLVRVSLANTATVNITGTSFYGNSSLRELDLSGCNINAVSDDAFTGCTSLTTIYVANESVKSIISTALTRSGIDVSGINFIIR